MSGRELAVREQTLDRWRQPEQPNRVGDRRSALADTGGHLVVRELEVLDQLLERRRFLERRQVLTMQVLDERLLDRTEVVGGPDDGRDGRQTGTLRRPPAPLTGDQFVLAVADRSDEDRLQHAHLGDRGRQLDQPLLGEVHAGLMGIRRDRRRGHVGERRAVPGARHVTRGDQRAETLSETATTRHEHGPPSRHRDRRWRRENVDRTW